jgi:hypothetical protein
MMRADRSFPKRLPDLPRPALSSTGAAQLQHRFYLDDECLRPKSYRGLRGPVRASTGAEHRRKTMKDSRDAPGSERRTGCGGVSVAILMSTLTFSGCTNRNGEPAEIRIANYRFSDLTIAVAPAVNLSGSRDFDPERFADLMVSELHSAERVSVIPVSRVLAVLASQGRSGVGSPAHAQRIAEMLGADALLVFAVTEYDPYSPPSLGITAQLYGARARSGGRNPMDAPGPPPDGQGGTATDTDAPVRLLAQSQRIFNASHHDVVEEIRRYASRRDGGRSPFGWRRYLVGQQEFIRFCCYSTIQSLINQ